MYQRFLAIARERKGLFLAVLAAMSIAMIPILGKVAMETMDSQNFAAHWAWSVFGIVAIGYFFQSRDRAIPVDLNRNWKALAATGLASAASLSLFAKAIQLSDPASVAFFNQGGVVYSVVLGTVFLSERFKVMELAGIVLTIAGILIISYDGGAIVLLALILVQVKGLTDAVAGLIVKSALGGLQLPALLLAFSFMSAIATSAVALASGSLASISLTNLALIGATAIFGALGRFGFLGALTQIKLSTASVVKGSIPLFVIAYSLVFLHDIPTDQQIVGGIFVILGIVGVGRTSAE